MHLPDHLAAGQSIDWQPVHLFALVESLGCAGASDPVWLRVPEAATIADVEATWATERTAVAQARTQARLDHPTPTEPRLDDWAGTIGEHRAAVAQVRALATDAQRAVTAAVRETSREVFAMVGARLVSFTSEPLYQGLDYHDEFEPGVPLAVVHNQGCRCGHGGVWEADWLEPDMTTPPLGQGPALPDGRLLVATCTSAGWPTFDQVDDALAAAAAAYTESLDCYRTAHETRVWAASLSEADVEGMDVATYKRYRRALPTGIVNQGWQYTRASVPVFDETAAQDRATTVYARTLATCGLYLLEER
jgi:hypothetical protein